MRGRLPRHFATLLVFALIGGVAERAQAGSFDVEGRFSPSSDAVVTQSFESSGALGDGGAFQVSCTKSCHWQLLGGQPGDELALDGEQFVRVTTADGSFDVDLPLPNVDASYVVRAWVRHQRVSARIVLQYNDGRDDESGYLFPTGRVTSDGWVELTSNPLSVTGTALKRAYLDVKGEVASGSLDLDAIEVVPEGSYTAPRSCLGAFDASCGPDAVCVAEQCVRGDRFVPPLPPPQYRDSVTSYLIARIRYFFGGRYSRLTYMPGAIQEMEKMRSATTPWQYWNAYFQGVRMLHDWHTVTSSGINPDASPRRLGACFVEGRADLTQDVWPSTSGHEDILVAYVGPDDTMGLHPGDRLVMVDGQNPIEWARSLSEVNWGYHVATDPAVDADFVEAMNDLIVNYARTFSVIRCDASTMTCSPNIETISVRDVPEGGNIAYCDNRPSYHLENPPSDPSLHYLGFYEWRDLVVDSKPGEDIYGMTFDNLYGPTMDQWFRDSNDFFRQNARGVILDHRAGNGGTIDAPEIITQLVRQSSTLSVSGFMSVANNDGPADEASGQAIFNAEKGNPTLAYDVGSDDPDLSLPVALIIDRDGSASDWLVHGMKGAPNVRIFGPHQSAGAFSSFYQYGYWSRIEFQAASGDTINAQGDPMIGHGIQPDVIVDQTQSGLMGGHDLPYEAALAWVRSRLQ